MAVTQVSVVVPVFNGMPHLRDLAESILTQTHADLDIVFCEGGGSDQSEDYLRTLTDPRVRVITMPKGTSAAGNWTAASEAARANVVKLVCQDDLLYPDAIATQLADLQAHPTAVMAVAQRDIIDARGHVVVRARGGAGLPTGVVSGAAAIYACYTGGTNVLGEPVAIMFRRDALLAAMPWDDSIPLVLDLACYAKVAACGDVVVRKEAIGAFRVSTSSWSTRLARQQVEQFARWQAGYAAEHHPSTAERVRARIGLHAQALLRRAAYRWLKSRGSFSSTP
jgi:glycosyltransferase involved in cell wall biosynthesis